MNEVAVRDAAAAELGFATQRLMDRVAVLNDDPLSGLVSQLFDSMTAYLTAQEALFNSLASETLRRVGDAT